MIAKIYIYILLMILIPYLYMDLHYLRHRLKSRWRRILWWLPGIGMAIFTLLLGLSKDFVPADISIVNTYLFLLGLLVVPFFVWMLCSMVGWGIVRLRKGRRNYGNLLGLVLVLLMWYVLFYGTFIGFSRLTVRHVTYSSDRLPASFDGYRIVQFSDAHVGTYGSGRQDLLRMAVDSINIQQPDAIVFTGDLQNRQPDEVYPVIPILSELKAKDGVFSVLGNHDYPIYLRVDDATKTANLLEIQRLERNMDWFLLLNEYISIRRDKDSIVIAGMENDGDGKKFPQLGDIDKTLDGVSDSAFVVMLQHDPSSWRRKILPRSQVQLTLSGHTHAMQFMLFGWSPVSFVYDEWGGWYEKDSRALFVSTGLGGFIPFRFGVPGEIVVITLKSTKLT